MHILSTSSRTNRRRETVLLWAISLLFLLGGCGKKEAAPTSATKPMSSATATKTASSGVPVPTEEPSEEALRKLEFQTYEAIDRAGGIPVTVSATGKSLTLRPKLYEVRKDSCKKTPQAPAGWYECSLTIKLSLAPDGSKPSEQGERIGVKWDPNGKWALQ